MKPLPIKAALNEDDRLGEVILARKHVLSLYEGAGSDDGVYYLTDNGNPDKIYMAVNRELWNGIFETEY